ncbi:sensor histidine kinase [Nonomuraea sp. NPDC049419]|uniref:sensor histidine kinase n=1 Tax=Nonomuraea sp. NPDC049419 TaxID=3155772 RepID=UPI00341B918B
MPVTSSPLSRMLRLGVIVLVGAGQAHTALVSGPPSIILSSALVLTLAVALLPFRIAGRRSADTPIPLIALGAATIIAVALHELTPNSTPALVLLACVAAAGRRPLPQSLAIALTAIVSLLVAGAITGDVTRNLTLAFSTSLVFLVAYAARQRKAIRQAEAREAVLAERARIARELHDILAHSLSAQLVHLEGAKLLLRAERTDEALDRVTRARDLAKSGLEEARRAVAALREDPPELPTALRRLAEEFESTTHHPCTLHISGPEHRLTPEAELALTRTAQEALTNIRRHAPGTPATIGLTFSSTWCDLRITNPTPPTHHPPNGSAPGHRSPSEGAAQQRSPNDAGAEQQSPGGGHGLIGMRERAELLGGTLTAGADDHGFTVHLRIPA